MRYSTDYLILSILFLREAYLLTHILNRRYCTSFDKGRGLEVASKLKSVSRSMPTFVDGRTRTDGQKVPLRGFNNSLEFSTSIGHFFCQYLRVIIFVSFSVPPAFHYANFRRDRRGEGEKQS